MVFGDTTVNRTRPAGRYTAGNLLSAASAVDAAYSTPLVKRAEPSNCLHSLAVLLHD